MSVAVRPYRMADPDAVIFGGWTIGAEGSRTPLPEFLPDWDYNTTLDLEADLTIDAAAVRGSTGIVTGAIRLSVGWRSIDGRIAHAAFSSDIGEGGSAHLELPMPGALLGPEVDIRTRLVLADDRSPSGPDVAHLAGSVLWENSTRLRLAGGGARFPVMVIDFGDNGFDRDASWTLDVPEDLTTPVHGGLMLMINSGDTALVAATSGAGGVGRVLLEAMYEQVGVQLLDHAVAHAEHLLDQDWEHGSLGETLRLLAQRYEGGLPELVRLRESRPSAYRAALAGEARRNRTSGPST